METICLLLIDPPRHRCNLQLWLTCLLGVACLMLLIGPLALFSLAGPLWGWSLQGRGGHAATVIRRKLAEQKFIQDIDRLLSRAVAFRSLHEKSEIKICLMLSVISRERVIDRLNGLVSMALQPRVDQCNYNFFGPSSHK